MAKFLRKVETKRHWDHKGEFSKYIPAGEASADCLGDLKTSSEALSVWELDDEKTNLNRILAAIASTREHLQKIDYLIVDAAHVTNLGLKIQPKPGQTRDAGANNAWHRDLIHLSASDLSRLANVLFEHAQRRREMEVKLIALLKHSVDEGHVDRAALRPGIAQKLPHA